jgi:hydrogenase maturation protease
MSPRNGTILVIGVGNEFRGDDAAGLHAVRRLAALGLDGVDVTERCGKGVDLVEAWRDADCVFIIDAAETGGKSGTIFRFEAGESPLPQMLLRRSTHDFGVAEAIELARTLGRLPPRLVVFGIEGASFGCGIRLSPEVNRALAELVDSIAKEIRTIWDKR